MLSGASLRYGHPHPHTLTPRRETLADTTLEARTRCEPPTFGFVPGTTSEKTADMAMH